ncbi:MAG TPA: DUF748 domain-containing protein [Opitutaceae bacterium]|nr:DUF748 domain-containing protein [Opitutaceae bacterium]
MRRVPKLLLWVFVIVVGVLVVLPAVLSPWLTRVANRKLQAMPQFSGSVESVTLALWRGSIFVKNLELSDRQYPEDGTVVGVAQGRLSLAWGSFIRGRLGGEGIVSGANVVMVKRAETVRDEKEKAEKLAQPIIRAWQKVLSSEFPMELRRLKVENSQVRFDDRSDPQEVSLTIDQIRLSIDGFSNQPNEAEPLPAIVTMTARLGGTGDVRLDARVDSAQKLPTFEAQFEVTKLSLPHIHDFLVKYALIDVSSGVFELYSEIQARGGHYEGYTKPFFKDLDFKAVPDPEKSFLQRATVKVASVAKTVLKNERGQIATRAPFSGNFEDTQVDVWTTLENLLRNAFIQALREGMDRQTSNPRP